MLVTMKGHSGAEQGLVWGSSVLPRGGGLSCDTDVTSAGVSWSPAGLRCCRQWAWAREARHTKGNVILANHSPASLVLSKILCSKKCKGSTPLKNYHVQYCIYKSYYDILYSNGYTAYEHILIESTCDLSSQDYQLRLHTLAQVCVVISLII